MTSCLLNDKYCSLFDEGFATPKPLKVASSLASAYVWGRTVSSNSMRVTVLDGKRNVTFHNLMPVATSVSTMRACTVCTTSAKRRPRSSKTKSLSEMTKLTRLWGWVFRLLRDRRAFSENHWIECSTREIPTTSAGRVNRYADPGRPSIDLSSTGAKSVSQKSEFARRGGFRMSILHGMCADGLRGDYFVQSETGSTL